MKKPKPSVHFSSASPEHYTPQSFLDSVRQVFGDIPDLDPCSNSRETPNVAAHRHYTIEDDGLTQRWFGRVFVNPPYGREIEIWIDKIITEWNRGHVTEIIALLPARPDTDWFESVTDRQMVDPDPMICFLAGRLTFVGNRHPAPFPSMAVHFGQRHDVFDHVFQRLGTIWERRYPVVTLAVFADPACAAHDLVLRAYRSSEALERLQ